MKYIAVAAGLLLLMAGAIIGYRALYVPWQHLREAREVIASEHEEKILRHSEKLLENKWNDLGIFKDTFFDDLCRNLEKTKDYGALDAQFMMISDYTSRLGEHRVALTSEQINRIEEAVKRFNEGDPSGLKWKLYEHEGKYSLHTVPPVED